MRVVKKIYQNALKHKDEIYICDGNANVILVITGEIGTTLVVV
jgi:hypothetical protein